jgi:4-amino-4-deoxy-L-arabinose transferase-like glycosyltransferase
MAGKFTGHGGRNYRGIIKERNPFRTDFSMAPVEGYKGSDIHHRQWFYILLAATTVFRLLYIQWVELAPDEAYYFTWSRTLQWGYYDHPPMVGFLILVFTTLAGQSEFGVRIGWVLMTALLSCLLYILGRIMFRSERAGFYAALLLNLILLASAGAIIVTPDGPQSLFWALSILFIHQAVSGRGGTWWYLTGIALGLGLLSKYTMILLGPCIFLFLLSCPEGRNWLRRKEPYLAFLLGLAIFSPVILWNAQHDWVSFRFQISHGLEVKKQIGLRYFGEYWAGQAGLVSPLLFLAILWAIIKSAYRGFRRGERHWLLLFWTSAPVLLFFAYTSLRAKVEANWPALAYFSAMVALGGVVAEGWIGWSKGRRIFAWVAGIMALLFTVLAHLQAVHALIPIPAHRDPTSQLHGWRGLGDRMKEVAQSLDPAKGIFLLTPRHQLAGEGMFYTQGKIPVFQWDAPNRINHLSPFNSPPAGSQGIFFTEGGNELPRGLEGLFEFCEKLEPFVVRRNSGVVRTHPIWKCAGFKGLQCNTP